MQMLVITESRILLEDTENGGVPTTTAYEFDAKPNLRQVVYEFDNETITYRRID